jgi:predicted nuclease of restriction endonuclease-like RecB superfamily
MFNPSLSLTDHNQILIFKVSNPAVESNFRNPKYHKPKNNLIHIFSTTLSNRSKKICALLDSQKQTKYKTNNFKTLQQICTSDSNIEKKRKKRKVTYFETLATKARKRREKLKKYSQTLRVSTHENP